MRRAIAPVIAVLACTPAAGAQSEPVTLAVNPHVVGYGSVVGFAGTSTARPGTPVHVYEQHGDGWHRVVSGRIHSDGTFRLAARLVVPRLFVARTEAGESPPVAVALRPLVQADLAGAPIVGGRLAVAGRVVPAEAGTVTVLAGSEEVSVKVGGGGRFEARLPTALASTYRVVVTLAPAPGYAPAQRVIPVRVSYGELALGSNGPPVRMLEERLRELRYVLPRADGSYRLDTFEAVLAFQKVAGLPATGRVDGRVWRALARARPPRPRVAAGDHLEVDRSRQVLFEVRGAEVVSVVHVSTGATGNTPVGRWRVYRKVAGWDWVLWYPLYFLRGFAIHGYPSVPPYPASHGCVRVPMWFANGLWSRWPTGATVWVFA